MYQHFLAKTYQSGFTDPRTPESQEPYVWVLERDAGKWKRRAPKNYAGMTDLHTLWLPDGTRDDSLETQLSAIEGKFSRVMKHDFASGPLDAQARADIATFIAALLIRPPRVFLDFLPQLLSDAVRLKRVSDTMPGFGDALENRFGGLKPEAVSEWFAQLTSNQQKAVVFWIMLPTIPETAKKLYNRTWIYALTASNNPFITSDTPICQVKDNDHDLRVRQIDDPSVVITMPLSATVALIAPSGNKQATIQAADDLVEELNNRVLWQSRTFILSCQKTFRGDYDVPLWLQHRGLADMERVDRVLSRSRRQ